MQQWDERLGDYRDATYDEVAAALVETRKRLHGECETLQSALATCQSDLAAALSRAEASEGRERHLLTLIEDAVQIGEMEGCDFRLMPWSTLKAASETAAAPPAPAGGSDAR